jgi:hypothetical protein
LARVNICYLSAVRNNLQIDNNAKWTHCCIYIVTIITDILLAHTSTSITIKRGCIVAFRL